MIKLFLVLKNIVNAPLNKKSPIKAILKFLKFQLLFKLNKKGYIVVPWLNKSMLLTTNGFYSLNKSLYYELGDYEEMSFLLDYLSKEKIFLDIGANYGIYTILASKEIGCQSYSFEPVEKTFDILNKNIILNNLTNKVKTFKKVLGDKNGKVTISNDYIATGKNKVLTDGEKLKHNYEEVESNKLDDLFDNFSNFTVLKIDVEGFEVNVLEGADKLLKSENLKVIIIEMNNKSAINNKLSAYDFKPYFYNPENKKIIEIENIENYNYPNFIYIRDLESVRKEING